MTQTEIQKTFILSSLQNLISPGVSAFRNVARPILAMDFARQGFELYGKGMPRFNASIKTLIEEGKVIRLVKGKNTYYTLP
jgi:hypothetical protein